MNLLIYYLNLPILSVQTNYFTQFTEVYNHHHNTIFSIMIHNSQESQKKVKWLSTYKWINKQINKTWTCNEITASFMKS